MGRPGRLLRLALLDRRPHRITDPAENRKGLADARGAFTAADH
jgi:hypothetical protein